MFGPWQAVSARGGQSKANVPHHNLGEQILTGVCFFLQIRGKVVNRMFYLGKSDDEETIPAELQDIFCGVGRRCLSGLLAHCGHETA